ncbi:MAG: P-loop NTPase [Micropruina sp.]|uniref:septum site-determining protein Ssd n=1 Tax=Micropruina sp. TaxID=2737536 RepID=UPI0039E23FC2
MEATQVLVVSDRDEVCEVVTTAAAALGHEATVCEPEAVAGHWRTASTVFIGVDSAAEMAALELPRREQVYLVGADTGAAALWSVPLGAEVIVLPQGRNWLSSVLAGQLGGPGEVVAVLGGSGGVGASTLAAALAWRAADRGRPVALVDADRFGGGIDLLLGAERVPGWRWPRFATADGVLGDLREFLPVVDGVTVLSMARGPDPDLGREPTAAVLGSLQRVFDLIVVDPGRSGLPACREALRQAARTLLVVGGSVRGVAAAAQLVRVLAPQSADVVVRGLPRVRVPDDVVEDSLGLPVRARLRHDPTLPVAAERGERPALSRCRGGLGRACDLLLEAS